jgi:hypothetical protein
MNGLKLIMNKTLGLIGAGKWGQNYIKLCDKLNINLKIGNRLNYKDLYKSCQGIIIATPPDSHVNIAIEALEYNIPVMIEKPLSFSYDEGCKLLKYNNILVNNLHLFSPAFEYIYNNAINIKEIISIGCNKGPYREYSSLFDYGPHDLSMGLYLCSKTPTLNYIKKINTNNAEQYNLNINYGTVNHNIVVGNAGPNKKRLFKVITEENNIFIYDDLKKDKLLFNNKSINISQISTLENSLLHFTKLLDGYIDSRFGVELSLKYTKFLESLTK